MVSKNKIHNAKHFFILQIYAKVLNARCLSGTKKPLLIFNNGFELFFKLNYMLMVLSTLFMFLTASADLANAAFSSSFRL